MVLFNLNYLMKSADQIKLSEASIRGIEVRKLNGIWVDYSDLGQLFIAL